MSLLKSDEVDLLGDSILLVRSFPRQNSQRQEDVELEDGTELNMQLVCWFC